MGVITAASPWCVLLSLASCSAWIFQIWREARPQVTGWQQHLSRTWESIWTQATILRLQRCNPFVWLSTCRKLCLLWMCGSILRAISKARKHQSDTECSVRGEWFTGLEGVSTRPWKANSKAKLSIPSISQLSALTGVMQESHCGLFFVMPRHMLSHKYVRTFTPRESWRSHLWDINDIWNRTVNSYYFTREKSAKYNQFCKNEAGASFFKQHFFNLCLICSMYKILLVEGCDSSENIC